MWPSIFFEDTEEQLMKESYILEDNGLNNLHVPVAQWLKWLSGAI